ncbi:PLAT/LH2 domain-containing protein [Alkalimarinus coralli]|uniref:PLAT/LH2 domain-containing protein n=1 Tax=Alkalimarinus coralli TaxID=2935863 RepID=UPI00202B7DB4|nr:PLAT/LH2 domain-containing protein [Alkalimarinus coralli]
MNKRSDNNENDNPAPPSKITAFASILRSIVYLCILGVTVFGGITVYDYVTDKSNKNSPSLPERVVQPITGLKSEDQNTADAGKEGGTNYQIMFETGNDGTDANISIMMYGKNTSTVPLIVNSFLGYLGYDAFKANGTDTLKVINQLDVGLPDKIKITSDNAGPKPEWHLKKVTIRTDQGEEAGYYPTRNIGGSQSGTITLHRGKEQKEYIVHITTADNNGTDSNATMTFLGVEGSKTLYNVNEMISGNAFEKGETEIFTFLSEDLGQLVTGKISLKPRPLRPNDSWTIREFTVAEGKRKWAAVMPFPTKIKTGSDSAASFIFATSQ